MDRWHATGLPNTLVATIPNARAFGQVGLTRGLPDLVVLGPQLPIGFIELKTAKGKLSDPQIAFKDLCHSIKARYAVTYGLDEAIQILEIWGLVKPDVRAA